MEKTYNFKAFDVTPALNEAGLQLGEERKERFRRIVTDLENISKPSPTISFQALLVEA